MDRRRLVIVPIWIKGFTCSNIGFVYWRYLLVKCYQLSSRYDYNWRVYTIWHFNLDKNKSNGIIWRRINLDATVCFSIVPCMWHKWLHILVRVIRTWTIRCELFIVRHMECHLYANCIIIWQLAIINGYFIQCAHSSCALWTWFICIWICKRIDVCVYVYAYFVSLHWIAFLHGSIFFSFYCK